LEDRLPEDRTISGTGRKHESRQESNAWQQGDANGYGSDSPIRLIEKCGVNIDELKAMDALHRQKGSLNRERRVISSNISAIERRLERHLDRIFKEVEKLNSRNDKEQEKLKSLEAEETALDRRRQEMLHHHAQSVDTNMLGFSIDPVHIPFSRDLNSAVNQDDEGPKDTDESAYSFNSIKRGYEKEIAMLEKQLKGTQEENSTEDDFGGIAQNNEQSAMTPPLEDAHMTTEQSSKENEQDEENAEGSESSSIALSRVSFDSDED
jgi:hypothetical protein